MQNAWNVQYVKEDRTVVRIFEGDSPKESGAVKFAKKLRAGGINCELISRRRGYPPPLKMKEPPSPGMMWCPYCIKWRDFEEMSIVRGTMETPSLLRCPTCTISVMDYYVRTFNPLLTERYFMAKELKRNSNSGTPTRKRRVRR